MNYPIGAACVCGDAFREHRRVATAEGSRLVCTVCDDCEDYRPQGGGALQSFEQARRFVVATRIEYGATIAASACLGLGAGLGVFAPNELAVGIAGVLAFTGAAVLFLQWMTGRLCR